MPAERDRHAMAARPVSYQDVQPALTAMMAARPVSYQDVQPALTAMRAPRA